MCQREFTFPLSRICSWLLVPAGAKYLLRSPYCTQNRRITSLEECEEAVSDLQDLEYAPVTSGCWHNWQRGCFYNARGQHTYFSSSCGLSSGTSLLHPANTGPKQLRSAGAVCKHEQESTQIAIVRPFTLRDADTLLDSFISWDQHNPCSIGLDESIDLVLVLQFSQNSSEHPAVKSTVQQVIDFAKDKMSECFVDVIAIDAMLSPQQDTFDQSAAPRFRQGQIEAGKLDWMSGPKRQFIRLAQQMRNFSAFVVLDQDTVPFKSGWLSTLTNEIIDKAPFAILGSAYAGGKWNSFRAQVPTPLLKQVSTNAVYNSSSAVFQWLMNT